ncbi:uncharacterized protein LOC100572510 [Acyrthosiphon pisum]|uniref:Uncharacterized protein n=1 Tax=Acyrthosiphon pisum TaxID=7029 RepID=A0A8R2JND5_ACYPI|nr:uncharacterized protein LOC100572510 [Acyrthosiphon pisum]|eukprot:XP_003243029.1 PREDICTED: uncharacterized protein LOC100572510 [Acyrthosiphon pisum]
MSMIETEKPGDLKLNYFSFAVEKIELKDEIAPTIESKVDAEKAAAATDMDFHKLPNLQYLLERYNTINIPNHSTFCTDQVLEQPTYVSNDKAPEIKAPFGMLNLYQIIQKFEHEHNCEFIFLPSSIGKDLLYYTENADLGLDPSHTVSNNIMDVLRYPLRYGLIPAIYGIDLEMFLASVFLKYKFDSKSTRRLKTKTLEGKVTFKFIEGEIEALVFDYWSRSTVDLINYDESVSRPDLKDLLQYLFRKLYGTTTVVQKNEVAFFLWNLRKFAKFDLSKDIISANCLYFLKTHISTVWPEISHNDMILWSIFFNEMNVHHLLMEHTISTMFKTLDRRFEFIMSKAAQVRAIRRKSSYSFSLWNVATTVSGERKRTVCKNDVMIKILPELYEKLNNHHNELAAAIDNFYYYHIFLLSRYTILHNIDVSTRILKSTSIQGFLDEQRNRPNHKICQLLILSMSEYIQSMIVLCFRRLYIRDSDTFEAEFEITEFEQSLYQSLNELICDRMNFALSTVNDREGLGGDPEPELLLYAYMYGLTRRESVSMQCIELNCIFDRHDKDCYNKIFAESNNVVKKNSSQKK